MASQMTSGPPPGFIPWKNPETGEVEYLDPRGCWTPEERKANGEWFLRGAQKAADVRNKKHAEELESKR